MKQFTAGKNEEGVRLSRFVQSVTAQLPTSLLYKSFRNKRIKVNGKRGEPDTRLAAGDIIELYINDEFFPAAGAVGTKAAAGETGAAKSPRPHKARTPLRVLFEDANIAVLYKPAHLLCHSDRTGDESLVELFTQYLTARGEYDAAQENTFSPAICNRLDRGTEGLVLAAKNYAALRDMNELIRADLVQKQYLCITVGAPPAGVHTAYLAHSEKNNKVTVCAAPRAGFREIITGVEVLQRKGPFALCRVDLRTGRTHQIRAHLAFLGAPVLGDVKYGNRKMNERTGAKTQALCAVSLGFAENIPAQNTLAYLAGRTVALEHPAVEAQFAAL